MKSITRMKLGAPLRFLDRLFNDGRMVRLVADDTCPTCLHDLDTGWECIGCGKDWVTYVVPAPHNSTLGGD